MLSPWHCHSKQCPTDSNLPASHSLPAHPGSQTQRYAFTRSVQLMECTHGLEAHSSKSEKLIMCMFTHKTLYIDNHNLVFNAVTSITCFDMEKHNYIHHTGMSESHQLYFNFEYFTTSCLPIMLWYNVLNSSYSCGCEVRY